MLAAEGLRVPAPPLVLVADPDDDTRDLFSLILRGNNLRVAETHNGPTTLAAARSLLPDILLTEVALPLVDGFDVAIALKQDPETFAIRIVGVTGYTRADLALRSVEAGFDDVLLKPVPPETLIAAIERGLATAAELRAQLQQTIRSSRSLRARLKVSREAAQATSRRASELVEKIKRSLHRDDE